MTELATDFPFSLDKDLCFIDLEATGLHIMRDRIIQIALCRFHQNGDPPLRYMQMVNPGVPLSREVSDMTGITTAMLLDKPSFEDLAHEIYGLIGSSDMAGYNSNRFDIPMLMEEFARAGLRFTMEGRRSIDVQRIFYRMEPRTLKAAHRFYCGSEMDGAHNAMSDVEATIAVLGGQIQRYAGVDLVDGELFMAEPVRPDVQSLHEFTTDAGMLDVTQKLRYNDQGAVVFNFGRYQGQELKQVFTHDKDYYHWIQQKEFSVQVKEIARDIFQQLKGNHGTN